MNFSYLRAYLILSYLISELILPYLRAYLTLTQSLSYNISELILSYLILSYLILSYLISELILSYLIFVPVLLRRRPSLCRSQTYLHCTYSESASLTKAKNSEGGEGRKGLRGGGGFERGTRFEI